MNAIACGLYACTVCQKALTVRRNVTFNLPRLYFSSSHHPCLGLPTTLTLWEAQISV